MLKLKRVTTYPVKIEFELDGLIEKGSFIIGDAKVRSREEMESLRDYINKEKPKDSEVIPMLYENFHGVTSFEDGRNLTGSDAFKEICEGKLNSYLMGPCISAYFNSFDAAKVKN